MSLGTIKNGRVIVLAALLLGCGLGVVSAADSSEVKLEALLVWGTNDSKSPDPAHRPVDAAVQKRLKEELPLKWSNYFEVNRKDVEVAANETKKITLSPKCDVEIKYLGQSMIEFSLIGKGEKVVKGKQALPKDDLLVLGGNAPNKTAWLVVLKRVK